MLGPGFASSTAISTAASQSDISCIGCPFGDDVNGNTGRELRRQPSDRRHGVAFRSESHEGARKRSIGMEVPFRGSDDAGVSEPSISLHHGRII